MPWLCPGWSFYCILAEGSSALVHCLLFQKERHLTTLRTQLLSGKSHYSVSCDYQSPSPLSLHPLPKAKQKLPHRVSCVIKNRAANIILSHFVHLGCVRGVFGLFAQCNFKPRDICSSSNGTNLKPQVSPLIFTRMYECILPLENKSKLFSLSRAHLIIHFMRLKRIL